MFSLTAYKITAAGGGGWNNAPHRRDCGDKGSRLPIPHRDPHFFRSRRGRRGSGVHPKQQTSLRRSGGGNELRRRWGGRGIDYPRRARPDAWKKWNPQRGRRRGQRRRRDGNRGRGGEPRGGTLCHARIDGFRRAGEACPSVGSDVEGANGSFDPRTRPPTIAGTAVGRRPLCWGSGSTGSSGGRGGASGHAGGGVFRHSGESDPFGGPDNDNNFGGSVGDNRTRP